MAVQVGIRSSGKPKEHWEKTFGVIQYWSSEVNKSSPSEVAKKIVDHYQSKGVTEMYVSFDIDALDAKYASATGTPEEDGLSPDVCARIIEEVSTHIPVASADMVEVAPFLNTNNGKTTEPDSTLMFAGSLSNLLIDKINSYLGK